MAERVLRLVGAVVARLPLGAIAPLGAALGVVAGSVLRVRRALVEGAMARARVGRPSRTAARVYRDLGRSLFELLWVACGPRERIRERIDAVTVVDEAAARALDQALGRGPVVLFASHTGNWELAAAAAAALLRARGRRLVVVAKVIKDPGVDAFVARVRASLGVVVVPPSGALAAARRALAAGDVVAMPIDQVPERDAHASMVPFLGALACVDRAPATLAYRARATVLVVAAERRRGSPAQTVQVLQAIASDAAIGRAWIGSATAAATRALDEFVRRAPVDWFWLHRRWRRPPATL